MKHPRYLIASDLHGSALYTRKLVEAFHREEADRLILLGDILYHGPRNDLPEGYAPKEVIALLSPLAERILCVRGNCDAEVDQMVLPFPIMAEYSLLPVDDLTVFITHGHHYNTDNPPPLHRGDVLLHGHTHVPACLHQPGGWWYLNPGSVSLPKEDSPRGYMTLEGGTFYWKTLEGRTWKEAPLFDAPPATTVRQVF
ncbi:MAG: phosphodiesterase [Ruminococcaceae bacterium]|nr:phosphodiesterase [Oscillospiraceae bacterium]